MSLSIERDRNTHFHPKQNNINILLRLTLILIIYLTSRFMFYHQANFVLVVLFWLIIQFICKCFKCSNRIQMYILTTYIARVLYAYLIDYGILAIPFSDSQKYLLISESLYLNQITKVDSIHFLYYYLLYGLRILFNNNTMSLYLANISLFIVSIVIFCKDVEKRFDGLGNIVLAFSFLSLNFFIFTTNILRESTVIFFVVLIILFYRKILEGERTIRYVLLLFVAFAFLVFTRSYTGYIMMITIALDYIIYRSKKSKTLRLKQTAKIIVVGALATIIVSNTILTNYNKTIMEYISMYASFESCIKGLAGIIRVFFTPFPWNMLNKFSVYTFTAIDSSVLILSSIFLFSFILKFIKSKSIRDLTLIYFLPIIAHGIVLGNVYESSSVRPRMGIFVFIILIYIVGAFYKPQNSG